MQPEISIKAYHNELTRVKSRDEANFVTLQIKRNQQIDFMILPKVGFDTARDEEKPVRKWSELPEMV